MTGSKRFTEVAIDAITAGVFAKANPLVVEAYSELGCEPVTFRSPGTLADYIKLEFSKPGGMAFFVVVYPDMKGCLERERINLNPQCFPANEFRYTVAGWGKISVQLYRDEGIIPSRITANSEKRAMAWAPTYPELIGPDTWDWTAVECHVRRLQRILKKTI